MYLNVYANKEASSVAIPITNDEIHLEALKQAFPQATGLFFTFNDDDHEVKHIVLCQNGSFKPPFNGWNVSSVKYFCIIGAPQFKFANYQNILSYHQSNYKSRDDLIKHYFKFQYGNKEILSTLLLNHGIQISLATLKRSLKRMKLQRAKRTVITAEIVELILQQQSKSGSCLGYRALWQRLVLEHKCCITRDAVMLAMPLIDPDGVMSRRMRRLHRRKYSNPGPNFLIHIDGYDKLKPFGFAIHGAICGFSRKILWLGVSTTNNNPRVIALYFLQYILNVTGVPRLIRADCGTETVFVKKMQNYFRRNHTDYLKGQNSFLYGRSTSNQRIEAWWAMLQRQCSDWWINFFKNLESLGTVNFSDPVDIECIRFCFMSILQKDIFTVAKSWNLHFISSRRDSDCPSGKPDIMYFQPELYNTKNYLLPLDQSDLEMCQNVFNVNDLETVQQCSEDFRTLVQILKPDVSIPTSVEQALELFVTLQNVLKCYLK